MEQPDEQAVLGEVNRETIVRLGGTSLLALVAAMLGGVASADAAPPKPMPKATGFSSIPLGLDFTDTPPPMPHVKAGHKIRPDELTPTPVAVKRVLVTLDPLTIPQGTGAPDEIYQFPTPWISGKFPTSPSTKCKISKFKIPKDAGGDIVYFAIWNA